MASELFNDKVRIALHYPALGLSVHDFTVHFVLSLGKDDHFKEHYLVEMMRSSDKELKLEHDFIAVGKIYREEFPRIQGILNSQLNKSIEFDDFGNFLTTFLTSLASEPATFIQCHVVDPNCSALFKGMNWNLVIDMHNYKNIDLYAFLFRKKNELIAANEKLKDKVENCRAEHEKIDQLRMRVRELESQLEQEKMKNASASDRPSDQDVRQQGQEKSPGLGNSADFGNSGRGILRSRGRSRFCQGGFSRECQEEPIGDITFDPRLFRGYNMSGQPIRLNYDPNSYIPRPNNPFGKRSGPTIQDRDSLNESSGFSSSRRGLRGNSRGGLGEQSPNQSSSTRTVRAGHRGFPQTFSSQNNVAASMASSSQSNAQNPDQSGEGDATPW